MGHRPSPTHWSAAGQAVWIRTLALLILFFLRSGTGLGDLDGAGAPAARRARLQGPVPSVSVGDGGSLKIHVVSEAKAKLSGADAGAGTGAEVAGAAFGREDGVRLSVVEPREPEAALASSRSNARRLQQAEFEPPDEVGGTSGSGHAFPASSFCRSVRSFEGGGSEGNESGEGYRKDSGECWSVKEWGCFSRNSGNAPSAELRGALERYVQRWKACNKEETPFQALMQLRAGKRTACRYIMLAPMEMGLGNQALSVVSAFAYALLTDRILYLEPRDNPIPDLFCDPFPGTPSWSLRHTHILGGPQQRAPHRLRYSFRTNDRVNLSEPAPAVLQFHVHHRTRMQRYFCTGFHSWAEGASVLLMSTNMWWIPALMFVPHLRTQLQLLFPTNRIFSTIAPLLLHPNNRVWHLVTQKLQEYSPDPPGATEDQPPRVGIQFREGPGWGHREALRSTTMCLLNRSAAFASGETSGSSGSAGQAYVFVSSLSTGFRGSLAQHLQASGVNASVISLTDEVRQRSDDPRHNERALVELLTVALAVKTLLLTPRSTFGYLMAAFSSADPWLLSTRCTRFSTEPCFLIPPDFVSCSTTDGCFDGRRTSPQKQPFTPGVAHPTEFDIEGASLGKGASISDDGAGLNDREGPLVTVCTDVTWNKGHIVGCYGLMINTK